jgi:hypothetical protein
MKKNTYQLLGIADELRIVLASCLLYDELMAARDASKPASPEELKKQMMNRLKQNMVEMINRSRLPGQERVNPAKLLQQIEKHLDTQRWPFKRQYN